MMLVATTCHAVVTFASANYDESAVRGILFGALNSNKEVEEGKFVMA
jgi:hypothetical protein